MDLLNIMNKNNTVVLGKINESNNYVCISKSLVYLKTKLHKYYITQKYIFQSNTKQLFC